MAEYATLTAGNKGARSSPPPPECMRLLARRQDGRVHYRPDVELVLYISTPPCGDASIYSIEDPVQSSPVPLPPHKLDTNVPALSPLMGSSTLTQILPQSAPASSSGNVGFLRRTGAKAISAVAAPLRAQAIGILRTKSGRSDLQEGDRTLSMSCSDKIARWNAVGLQGSLLSLLLPGPLYLDIVVIGLPKEQEPRTIRSAAVAALERALVQRTCVVGPALLQLPCNDGETARVRYRAASPRLLTATMSQFSASRPAASGGRSQRGHVLGHESLQQHKPPPKHEHQQVPARTSACGYTIAWHCAAASADVFDNDVGQQHVAHAAAEVSEPCISLIRLTTELHEVTVGATGRRQGLVATKAVHLADDTSAATCDIGHLAPALCRRNVLRDFGAVLRSNAAENTALVPATESTVASAGTIASGIIAATNTEMSHMAPTVPPSWSAVHQQMTAADGSAPLGLVVDGLSYMKLKQLGVEYREAAQIFDCAPPFLGWLHGGRYGGPTAAKVEIHDG
jgi:hypothetical protein